MSRALGYALYLALATLLLSEVTLRAWYATRVGPRILLYGTPGYRRELPGDASRLRERAPLDGQVLSGRTVYLHTNHLPGYTKYFPNEIKYDVDPDTGERHRVGINRHGFRGRDFSMEKEPGVVRVVTLGASSTFGYYSRDHETYPHQMEELLNQRCRSRRFEVVNLGIPHAGIEQIAALFASEGLALAPDVVTFYEGRNNTFFSERSVPLEGPGRPSGLAARWLLVRYAENLRGPGGELFRGTPPEMQAIFERKTGHFLRILEEIAAACRERDILFVPATQQATAGPPSGISREGRRQLEHVSLSDEVRGIEAQWTTGGAIRYGEAMLLIHDRMQRALREWALDRGLPLVDVIEILDGQRQYLVSWVHLHPRGNRIVASAFADEILRHTCPE